MLQVAPSAYRRHAALVRDPHKRCARACRDEVLAPQIQRVWQANMQVYGADKIWRQLAREGVTVARCTVERLMQRLGLRGAMRGKVVRTTISDSKAPCPLDSGQPAVQGGSAQSALGVGLHLCLDLAGLAVRGLRHRRLRPAHRGLAGEQFDANGLRARCTGAGAVCPQTRAGQQPGPSQRQGGRNTCPSGTANAWPRLA